MIESQTISTLASRLEIAALAHPESFEVQQLRERVKRADALVASLSAAGLVTICHTSICARTREDISALVLYGLKLCQLKDKMFYERARG